MATAIDVCMPTYESEPVIEGALDSVAEAEARSALSVRNLILVDNESDDDTRAIARRVAEANGWTFVLENEPLSLPKARERAIELVESDWFLFLDDDVRVAKSYLRRFASWVDCDRVGAVQGRKVQRTEHPSDWVRRRSRRGGTHATLIRTAAVRGVTIPRGVEVLEDEFLRQVVESRDYRWILEPNAWFRHESQERHPIGWTEGYVGGKYGLSAGHTVALNVPFALATGRNPLPHVERLCGWVAGRLARDGSESVERDYRYDSEAKRLE